MVMNIQPWQVEMLKKMSQYKGRGLIQITGRHSGKNFSSARAIERLMNDLMNRPIEDLVLSENRVHGARYYCVEPVGGNWKTMELWAHKHYGEPGEFWSIEDFAWPENPRWFMNDRKFWFRKESDRTMFVLKWR